jgi:hypothetical protein
VRAQIEFGALDGRIPAPYKVSATSTVISILAVFSSMAVAEQYFSCADYEMKADAREDLRIGRRALGKQPHLAAAHVVPPPLKYQYHIVGCAPASTGEQHLHRARRQVSSAPISRTVHGHEVSAAGLGRETHPGRATPPNHAFHARLLKMRILHEVI